MSINQYSIKVDLLLAQYVKYYPLYKLGNNSEHDKMFHSIEANLNKTYTDMFLLENKYSKELDTLRTSISEYNTEIKASKNIIDKLNKQYTSLQGIAGASGPMLHQKNEIKQKKQEELSYYLSAALVVLYLTSRNFFTD